MLEAYGASDPGCVRSNNEDYFLVIPAIGLYLVADGMGGAQAGEHASRLAAETIQQAVTQNGKTMDSDGLVVAFGRANQRVMDAAASNPEMEGMGTTLVAAVENGGLVLSCSDMFFGHRHNMIMPGRAANMSDGWETKRRRGPGHDWAVIKLGAPGQLHHVEVDTSHFKGNFPESCSLEAFNAEGIGSESLTKLSVPWKNVLDRTRLQAHTRHDFHEELHDVGIVSHLRFNIFPDGGVSRLRVYGSLA